MKRLETKLILTLLVALFAAPAIRAADIDYVGDVKPILVKHCLKCHNRKKQESGLRLDLGGGLLRGGDGGPVVVAKDAANSRLVKIIKGTDDEIEQMPPDGPPLSPREIADIESWIASGAQVPASELNLKVESDHWAFQRPTRPGLPAVESNQPVRYAIDHFVLAKLQSRGLAASAEAAPATLIRRVSLDLLGIPPTPAEVDAFVNDARPDAYARLVDRLLASPRVWRALGPALARPGEIRRQQWLYTRLRVGKSGSIASG